MKSFATLLLGFILPTAILWGPAPPAHAQEKEPDNPKDIAIFGSTAPEPGAEKGTKLNDPAEAPGNGLNSSIETGGEGRPALNLEGLGPNPRFAVLNLKAEGVEPSLTRNLSNALAVELKSFQGVEVISQEEIKALLEFEATKQAMGCDDLSCFAEIGNALGVPYLVVGSVGLVENTYLLNLQVVNIREVKILGREAESYQGPTEGLLGAARIALRRIFGVPYQGDGFLRLSANVEDVEVSLNGQTLGRWPELRLPESLATGKIRLEARKEGYFPLAQDAYIEPGRMTDAALQLTEEPAKWWQTWWFWTVTGAVVAGGVTTGVVLGTQDSGSPAPAGGTVKIR